MSRRPGLLLALTVALAWPSPARAQTAVDLFKQGTRSLKTGDLAGAADAFARSYELSPKAATVCNLALSYDRWPLHEREALEAYRKCAEDDESGKFSAHALERARALRKTVAALPPQQTPPARAPAPIATRERDSEDRPPPRRRPQPTPAADEDRRANDEDNIAAPEPVIAPRPRRHVAARRDPATEGEGDREPPADTRSHTLLYVGVVGGVLAAGCFVAGYLLEQSASGDYNALLAQYPNYQIPNGNTVDIQRRDSAESTRSAGIALYATTAVLGVAAVALAVYDLTRGPSRSRVEVGLGPAAASLSVHF